MICKSCGMEIGDNSLYCEYCGVKQMGVEAPETPVNALQIYGAPGSRDDEVELDPMDVIVDGGQYGTGYPDQFSVAQEQNDFGGHAHYRGFNQGQNFFKEQNQSFNGAAPGADPVQGMNYNQGQPQGGENWTGAGQKTAKNKIKISKAGFKAGKKLWVTIGIAAGSLAVLAVIGLLVWNLLIMTPERRVMQALRNTYNQENIIESFAFEQKTGVYETMHGFMRDGGVMSIDTDMEIDWTPVEGTIEINKKNSSKGLSAEVALDVDDVELGGTMIGDATSTYLYEEGSDGYIYMENADIISQMKKSPLFEDYVDDQEDFSINWFSDRIIEPAEADNKEELEKLEKTFKESVEIKSAGSEKVTIGDGYKRAKKYNITISEDNIEDLIEDYIELMKTTLRGPETQDAEERLDELSDRLKSINFDDITGSVCVYKKNIASLEISFQIKDKYNKVKYTLETNNTGKGNILSSMDMEFKLTANGSKTSVKLEKNSEIKDNTAEDIIEMTLSDGRKQNYTIEIETDKKNNIDVSFDDDGYNSFDYRISLDEVKPGKAFSLQLEDVELELLDIEIYNMTLSVNASPSKAKVLKKDKSLDTLNLFEADEEDIMDFVDEDGFIYALVESLY